MRFFLMKPDKRFQNVPEIANWYQNKEVRLLMGEEYTRLPKRILFGVKGDENTIYIDVLFHPFFLISERVQKIISLYEPNLSYKEIIYLNQKMRRAETYYLPILPQIGCLTENSQFNLNHSKVTRASICEKEIGDTSIFQLNEIKDQQVIIRLDLAESLMRRMVRGFLLEETEYEEEKKWIMKRKNI